MISGELQPLVSGVSGYDNRRDIHHQQHSHSRRSQESPAISMGSLDYSDILDDNETTTSDAYFQPQHQHQQYHGYGTEYAEPLKDESSSYPYSPSSVLVHSATPSARRNPRYPSFIEVQTKESSASSSAIYYSEDSARTFAPTKDLSTSSLSKLLWDARKRIDKNALQFALRMAVLLTISSLFVLIQTDNVKYPDGMWVLVSVLFVCWFPALDAASVIEKIIQRLIGTFVGATLGLTCGFLSLVLWKTRAQQATFLAFCLFVITFGIIFLAGQCKVGPLKVIKKFNYATILCVLTFCISMIPFGTPTTDPKWELGAWRVVNVMVGCALGALGSIVVCPKSTTDVLFEKTARQVRMAGEASEAVLHVASEFLSGRIQVNRLSDELLNTPLESEMRWKLTRSSSFISEVSSTAAMDGEDHNSTTAKKNTTGATDVALKKYEDAIADWKVSKALFPLTKYDPFQMSCQPDEESTKSRDHQTEIARTLARALRIQTTIVVLDGMIRSDAEYTFTEQELDSFYRTGSLIRTMLKVPLNTARSNEAARALFHRLEEVRSSIRKLSMRMAAVSVQDREAEQQQGLKEFREELLSSSSSSDDGNDKYEHPSHHETDDLGRGIPKDTTGKLDNSLFFLQLVEHLILRSLRLYQAWKLAEPQNLERGKKRIPRSAVAWNV